MDIGNPRVLQDPEKEPFAAVARQVDLNGPVDRLVDVPPVIDAGSVEAYARKLAGQDRTPSAKLYGYAQIDDFRGPGRAVRWGSPGVAVLRQSVPQGPVGGRSRRALGAGPASTCTNVWRTPAEACRRATGASQFKRSLSF